MQLNEVKKIFPVESDKRKVFLLTCMAFLFVGFLGALYGMVSPHLALRFKIDAAHVIFYNSFGFCAQLIGTVMAGWIISRIKGVNTLVLAATLMVVSLSLSIYSLNIYFYTAMTSVCNFAIGLIIVSSYYMLSSAVTEKGKRIGSFCILNVFFSLGFMLSPLVNEFIIKAISWPIAFMLVSILFMGLITIILFFNINESLYKEVFCKEKMKIRELISLPFLLIIIAFFLLIYTEQIMNQFMQPHLRFDHKMSIEFVGMAIAVYSLSQMAGRFLFGIFLLPFIKTYKYIILSSLAFAIFLFIFGYVSSPMAIMFMFVLLGLADSCLYPSLLVHAINRAGDSPNPGVISFILGVGAIGIPAGMFGSIATEKFLKSFTADYIGAILLVFIIILVILAKKFKKKEAHKEVNL